MSGEAILLLWQAALRGDVGLTQEAVAQQANPNVQRTTFWPSLYHQLPTEHTLTPEQKNQVFAVKWQVSLRERPDTTLDRTRTPLLAATELEHSIVALLLLKAGADPRFSDEHGFTALHFAAENGDASLCDALIRAGATVDAPLENQETPLHRAARLCHVQTLRLLLNAGANPNARTDDSETILHAALDNLISFLHDRPRRISEDREQPKPEPTAAARRETVQMLRAAGAEVNTISEGNILRRGRTPLGSAADRGDPLLIQILLDARANVNPDGVSEGHVVPPLIEAIPGGNALSERGVKQSTEAFFLLLDKGADVNARIGKAGGMESSTTPLSGGDGHRDTRLLRALLKRGADPHGRGAVSGPLTRAASANLPDNIALLLAAGADINETNEN